MADDLGAGGDDVPGAAGGAEEVVVSPAVPGFTGRSAELEALTRLLDQHGELPRLW